MEPNTILTRFDWVNARMSRIRGSQQQNKGRLFRAEEKCLHLKDCESLESYIQKTAQVSLHSTCKKEIDGI